MCIDVTVIEFEIEIVIVILAQNTGLNSKSWTVPE